MKRRASLCHTHTPKEISDMETPVKKMCVLATKVWFVVEENDRPDIRAGGSKYIGPFYMVVAEDTEKFIAAMEEYIKKERPYFNIWYIHAEWQKQYWPIAREVPTPEEEIAACKAFLDTRKAWNGPPPTPA